MNIKKGLKTILGFPFYIYKMNTKIKELIQLEFKTQTQIENNAKSIAILSNKIETLLPSEKLYEKGDFK